MTYQTVIIILCILNILLGIDAWWLATQCNKADKKVKELEDEMKANKQIVPIAQIKAEFSEEDMKTIKDTLKDIVDRTLADKGELSTNDTNLTCKCDHLYDSIILTQDPKYCREKLVFRCSHCNHEETLPIRNGLIMDLIMNGGKF